MNWTLLIPIIAQYGIPLAEKLYQKWASGTSPTQADFDELRKIANSTAKDEMAASLVSAGIPLDSPQAIALLNLTK